MAPEEPDVGKPLVRLCVQRRLACSAGVSPARVKVRSSVAWMAGWKETETLMPIDKAIFRVVSKSPGRNANERRGGPENAKPRRPSLQPEGEGSMGYRRLTEAVVHSGGVVATAR